MLIFRRKIEEQIAKYIGKGQILLNENSVKYRRYADYD
jgi:hypothetical protein